MIDRTPNGLHRLSRFRGVVFSRAWAGIAFVLAIVFSLAGSLVLADPEGEDDPDHEYEEGEILVELAPGADPIAFAGRWNFDLLDANGALFLFGIEDQSGVGEVLDAVVNDSEVVNAEENRRQHSPEAVRQMVLAAIGGTVEDFEDQMAGQRIGLEQIHEVTSGVGAIVAILDTGIDPSHQLFAEGILPGYDFVDQDTMPWEEANGRDDNDDGQIDGGWGHGSMVAGLVRWIAPDAKIIPIRVLDDEGVTNSFRVLAALDFAVAAGADVINLSFGSPIQTIAIEKRLDWVREQDVVVVGAAGNRDRPGPAFSPADDKDVIMVTALDPFDVKAEFADYHQRVTLSAPGTALRSAFPGDEWALGSGCSFATALVSGGAALCRSLEPSSGVEDVWNALESSTVPVDEIPANVVYAARLGIGRLDLRALPAETSKVDELDPRNLASFWVSPNPAKRRVRVQLRSHADAKEWNLVNVKGQVVRRGYTSSSDFSLELVDEDFKALPGGAYFLQLGSRSEVPGHDSRRIIILR